MSRVRVVAAMMGLLSLLQIVPLQARIMLAPDADGYQLIDSAERYGPSYSFYDISTSGTRLNLKDDESSGPIRLNFGFDFYGKTYYSIYISDNGYISFVPSDNSINQTGAAIPQPAGTLGRQTPPFIAPWFDDLDPELAGAIYYERQGSEAGKSRMVVQWSVAHHNDTVVDGSVPLLEFEVVLFEGTNKILFQYRQTATNKSELSHGGSATVGTQGSDTEGINYSANQPLITDLLAIGFTPYKYGYVGIPLPPEGQSAAPGDVVNYQVQMINGKSEATNFYINQLPGARWQVSAPTTTGLLQPGEPKTLSIDVTVPAADATSMTDDILGFKITDYLPTSSTTSDGNTSGSTDTQNNQKVTDQPVTNVKETASLVYLKTTCVDPYSSLACYQKDSDGDGVPDDKEDAGSVNDASRIDGFAVLSKALVNIELDQAKDSSSAKGKFHGLSMDEFVDGPSGLKFAEGIFNTRITPPRVGDSVTITYTPSVAWPSDMVLYQMNADGTYSALDKDKWARVDGSNAIQLIAMDGGAFDEDGATNGVIVTRVAMGVTYSAEANRPGFGHGGALVDELLMLSLLGGLRYYRRRRAKQ